jgi:hypothetical protein
VTLSTTVASNVFLQRTLSTGARVASTVRSKADLDTLSAKSLNFQLVQSQIDLTWGLVKLVDGLRALNKIRDTEEAIGTAKSAFLKAENYAEDLVDPESLAVSSSLEHLRDVIATW